MQIWVTRAYKQQCINEQCCGFGKVEAKQTHCLNIQFRMELFINDYNPTILLIWAANIDILLSMILNRYITTYVTKAEKNVSKANWNEVNQRPTLHAP